ncbi:MAG: PhzF family phenazine biosynthesis isomerase, partial [Phenylobacterium sp.]|nr:PhzF family phenazine biosynthesis isomerase [Phenylobacterium sp.]
MPTYAFVTLDVFTDRPFGGNPLAVFTDARGMTDAQMQSLAAEMNLSETTFVLPPSDPANTARVRIFHRTGEMPFAGHPSIGTGYVLATLGHEGALSLEMIAGLVKVDINRDGDGAPTGVVIAA